MRHIGIAVVGCGQWGMNYVRVLSELPEPRPIVVCDRRPEQLSKAGTLFPGVRLCTTLEDALNAHDVDAVVVGTGASEHYAVVRRCLEAGRHVLVEKPITTRAAHAEELVRAARDRGLVLMVGHIFMYNAGVRCVKEYIACGQVGRIYYLYSRRTNLGPIRSDVNALWDLAPHDVSIFNYLLEDVPLWVSAVGSSVLGNGREDVGFVSLGYPNNVIGHAHLSWADPHKVRELVVVGSDRRIVFDDLNPQERVRVFEKGVKALDDTPAGYAEHQFFVRDGDIIIPKIEFSEPLKDQCQHFIACVQQGCTPLTDSQSGLDVVRVLEAVHRSLGQRGAPVALT
jgi:predicted dehydrogenase